MCIFKQIVIIILQFKLIGSGELILIPIFFLKIKVKRKKKGKRRKKERK